MTLPRPLDDTGRTDTEANDDDRRRGVAAVALGLALVAAAVVAAGAGTAGAVGTADGGVDAAAGDGDAVEVDRPATVVSLYANGTARVAVVETFDLSTDGERAAFERLERNETAQAATRERFADRVASVAARTAERTGRAMTVEAPRMTFRRTGDGTGVVTLSVRWTDLAATDGDRLVLAEPFASGFAPDRAFVIELPDGYAAAEVSPAPNATGDGVVRYDPGTDLEGFRLAAAPVDATTEGASDGTTTLDGGTATGTDDAGGTTAAGDAGGQPGLGAPVAALALGLWVAVRRRRRGSITRQGDV